MKRFSLSNVFAISLITTLFFLGGCKPDYPSCDKDEHCREGEFCVDKKCQKCRNDDDCAKGQTCNGGRCEAIAGYCESDDACPKGQVCKNNQCGPCSSDADCGEGGRCSAGKCLGANQCSGDEDCPENWECRNGTCVAPPQADSSASCTPETIYFNFDEFVLTEQARQKLQNAATCIKSVPDKTIRVEGHCDPRGTEEYNLALGDRRAQSVATYLQRLGVPNGRTRPVSKGEIEATGTNDSSWAQDRKVDFIWE